MIRKLLVLGGIGMAMTFAQNAGAQASGLNTYKPVAPAPGWKAPMTPWGEPDLQGIWPINHLIAVPLERARQNKDLYLSDEAWAKLSDSGPRKRAAAEIPVADNPDRPMRQTSLIIDPPDGHFPALTDYGKKLQAEMKSSYRPGQTVFDSVADFSAWDRCITRGMPVSMEPRNYNNGIRIMQSPGYVVILLEMAHEARIIPTSGMPALDSNIKEYLGESRGHWEGNTLVVETTNFNGLVGHTSAGVPGSPGPLQPETPNMKITERFTRVANDTIEFKMTVTDPSVLATGSYTVAYPTFLENNYEMYEYACHEGNTAVRNYIVTSRYEREHPKEPKK
ncbi:MAG TPA: hypothetical protein VGN17_26645 [Bryobacteraceae bacterium]|jgi:hypothetical protein